MIFPSPFDSRMKRYPASGFTLIELLTVIAIMGILGVILITVVGQARQMVDKTECASNMRQLGIATMAYVQEHDGKYPLSNSEGSWDLRLIPYFDHPGANAPTKILKCPSDPRDLILPGVNNFARSYSVSAPHQSTDSEGNVVRDNRGMVRGDFSRQISELTHPADTVFLAEWFSDGSGTIFDGQRQFKPAYAWLNGWYVDQGGGWPSLPGKKPYHGEVMNFCFADGHVESIVPWEIDDSPNRWLAVRGSE